MLSPLVWLVWSALWLACCYGSSFAVALPGGGGLAGDGLGLVVVAIPVMQGWGVLT